MKNPRRTRFLVLAGIGAVSLSIAVAASLSTQSYRYLNVFTEVWGLTRSNYVEPVDESALLDGAFRGMTATLDGASAYLAPGEDKLASAPVGPGRPGMETLPTGGAAIIVRVDPGGPAARAGLDVGDQVWKVAGKSLRQQAWPMVKRRLSGAVGGKLDLTILDGRTFKLRDVKLDLETPKGPGYLLERRDGPVLYLRLYDPDLLDAKALAHDLAQKLGEDKALPLLIDLRGTVGLDPQSIARAGGVFYPGAPVLRLVPRTGTEETVAAPEAAAASFGTRPVFTLIDGTTGGAGEALAALLKEKSGVVLCGRATYGLAGVPEIIPLSRGGSLLLATREMRTPGGARWSEKGMEPDKLITPPTARTAGDEKRDYLLEDALKLARGKA